MNDYLQGYPVDNEEDPHDVNTYCGAVRIMIETLLANRPDAKILLIAPNAVTCHQQGTQSFGDNGAPLNEYADALLRLGESYGIPVQDDFHDVIPLENADYYLTDQLHPNEYGRYKISKELIRQISDLNP